MSANNEIVIRKKNGKYYVRNEDVEGLGGWDIGTSKTIEDAIRLAQKEMQEDEVEYGMRFEGIET